MQRKKHSTRADSLCARVEFSKRSFSNPYKFFVKAGTQNTVVDADDAVNLDAHHTMLFEVSGTEPWHHQVMAGTEPDEIK